MGADVEALLEFERMHHGLAVGAFHPQPFGHVVFATVVIAQAGFAENSHGWFLKTMASGGFSRAQEANSTRAPRQSPFKIIAKLLGRFRLQFFENRFTTCGPAQIVNVSVVIE